MKFICYICQEDAFYNEKLGIHFCKKHGFKIMPDIVKSCPV